MNMVSRVVGLVAAAGALLAAGCGGDGSEPAAVRGRVLYRGEPLAGGSIVFTPNADKGGRGPLARADVGPDGRYTLRPGAAPGWHRVTVVCVESGEEPPAGQFAAVRCVIPHKYSAPDLSGLEALVKAGEENVIDFRLE
jgi:hypothetical protein